MTHGHTIKVPMLRIECAKLKGRKRMWRVVDRDGVQHGARQYSAEDAQTELREMTERLHRRTGRRTRPCLTCGSTFESTGFGHRMCDPCRLRVREAAW